jgi:hypothetical protein
MRPRGDRRHADDAGAGSGPEALERLQRVVVDHVKRFAFREDLGEVSWTPTN